MMDFLFCSPLLSQPFFIDDSQNAEAFLGRSHRNKSQLKKLMPRRRSDEKKYSEWAENDSLGSVSSRGNDLLDCAELEEEEIEKKSTIPLHLKRKRVRIFLSIHFGFLVVFSSFSSIQACSGRFVNPMTDICWSCLFPISIGPVKVSGGGREDTENPHQIPCVCPRAPYFGIPVGFWEPARLVDVTRVPFCMVSMGGLKMGNSFVNYGVHGANGEQRTQNSFYQVHWYVYPVIYWLELLVDFLCLEQQSFDVAYITELDPLWNADELSFILNPEAILFGNPIAQAACAADCVAATAGFPLNPLFWCGGCQGSLYPFTGNNPAHNGGVQASLLMVQRMMAKLHRELLLWGTSGITNAEICQKYPLPIIKKSQYKTQMTYPRPTTRGPMACNPLGRTEVIWGTGREFPYKGEDFGYLIWRKRNCCAL
jgi:conjugal transfer pilus assembly protein TraU